jgi:hypothetical protein
MSVKYFLFLEILDRDVNAFYEDVIARITGHPPVKPPHLTIRGPYKNPIPREELEKFREAMRFAVLRIGGVGRFTNPSEEVVYIRVESPQLRTIWWKPDYPISAYGYNPHISLYRGPDHALADRLASFEPLTEVVFNCAEYRIVPVVKNREYRELELREYARAADHARLEARAGFPKDFFQQLDALVRYDEPPTRQSKSAKLPAQFTFEL